MSLQALFASRHAEISVHRLDLDEDRRLISRADRIDPVRALCRRLFADVVKSDAKCVGSFIAEIPIPSLLSARQPLTVDICPPFLKDMPRFYGIDPRAIIEMAKNKVIFLNIRDFDPLADEDTKIKQAKAYGEWEPFINELFDEASNSIYFGAGIREIIFDALPRDNNVSPRLRDIFEGIKGIVEPFAAHAAKEIIERKRSDANFRGEAPSAAAVCWHWAFLTRMGSFLDAETKGRMQDRLDDLSRTSHPTEAFIDFARYLRYLHVLCSAPLTASFGGVYNSRLDDDLADAPYSEASAFLEYLNGIDDDTTRFLTDLQLGRMDASIWGSLSENNRTALRFFGVESFTRRGSETFFEHYRDAHNLDRLIEYVREGEDDDAVSTIDKSLDELLDAKDQPLPKELIEVAALSFESRCRRATKLVKATDGFQIIEDPDATRPEDGSSHLTSVTTKAVTARLRASQHDVVAKPLLGSGSLGSFGDAFRRFCGLFQSSKKKQ